MTPPLTILQGSALELLKTLPDESVHCCVTSPPYWGLRDYSACSCSTQRHTSEASLEWCRTKVPGASGQSSATDPRCKKEPDPACPKCHGTGKIAGVAEHQLGLEKTPEEYIAKMVTIFREVRRVLRSDGTCWINIGDSYASHPGQRVQCSEVRDDTVGYKQQTNRGSHLVGSRDVPGLKPKDMVGIPWMLAFALRADGWYLRSEIIWAKRNAMPESVTDRPTKSHEQIFLLAKSSSYFYDAHAIKEPQSQGTHERFGKNPTPSSKQKLAEAGSGTKNNGSVNDSMKTMILECGRNKRDVWFIGTQPYSEAHFATFPPDLIKPCILAGTSARGCCPSCGAPWERIVEDGAPLEEWKKASGADRNGEYHGQNTKDYERHKAQPASTVKERILKGMVEKNTVRWEPTCTCPLENPVPCTVLDPFFGSGTTGQVALEFGRHAIGLELNPEYIELCKTRCHTTQGLALA